MFEIPNEFIRAVTKSAEETEEKVRDNESSKYRMSTVPCERLFIAGEITLFGNVLSDSTSVKEFLKKITVFISDSVYKGYSQGKSTVK